jgi:hypothetical protein
MSHDQQKGYEHALRTEIIESQNTQADRSQSRMPGYRSTR